MPLPKVLKYPMINIPFAHAEGRFVMPAELLKELQKITKSLLNTPMKMEMRLTNFPQTRMDLKTT